MLVGGPEPPMATRLRIRNLLCLSSMFAIHRWTMPGADDAADDAAGRKSYRWDVTRVSRIRRAEEAASSIAAIVVCCASHASDERNPASHLRTRQLLIIIIII